MAEAFARLYGAGSVEAFSAGSRPSGQISPRAIEAMREIGYDPATHHSKSIDSLPDIPFDYVITMGCGDECPLVPAVRREDWDIPDPKLMSDQEFRQVRDLIGQKVKKLIDTP